MTPLVLLAAVLTYQPPPAPPPAPSPASPPVEKSKPRSRVKAPARVSDPNWVPKDGDAAWIGTMPAYAGTFSGWADAERFINDNNKAGLAAFVKTGEVVSLPSGTPVRIIKRHNFRIEGLPRVLSADDIPRIVARTQAEYRDVRPNFLEIRPLEGEHKDEALFVREVDVIKLVDMPTDATTIRERVKPKARPNLKPANPAARPGMLLTQAKNLEKAKNLGGAIGFYRKLIEEYPDSPQSREAAKRIEVLAK